MSKQMKPFKSLAVGDCFLWTCGQSWRKTGSDTAIALTGSKHIPAGGKGHFGLYGSVEVIPAPEGQPEVASTAPASCPHPA